MGATIPAVWFTLYCMAGHLPVFLIQSHQVMWAMTHKGEERFFVPRPVGIKVWLICLAVVKLVCMKIGAVILCLKATMHYARCTMYYVLCPTQPPQHMLQHH